MEKIYENYEIGDIVDIIIDKNGKEWHVKKVDENVYEFVEALEFPWPKPMEPLTMEPIIKWLDENLTEEKKKKWGFDPNKIKVGQPIKEKPKDSVMDVTDKLFAC